MDQSQVDFLEEEVSGVEGSKGGWRKQKEQGGRSQPATLVRKQQETGEDAVGALSAHHAVVVVDCQPYFITPLHPQQYSSRADLLAIGHVVAEAGHLDTAVEQLHAQVGCLRCMVDKVVEAGHFAGELPCACVIIPLRVGDNRVELDQAIGHRELGSLSSDCEH